MKSFRYFQFLLGILAGFFLSGLLFILNGEYASRIASSVFQLQEESQSSRSPEVSSRGEEHRSDTATAVLSGGIVGRSVEHILVKFKSNVGQERRNQVLAERGSKEKSNIPQIDVKLITIPPGKTPEDFVNDIKSKHGEEIEFAEMDTLVAPDITPNDPLYPSQWHHTNVQTSTAWDSVQGEGIIVATLDTGLDIDHPDILLASVSGWNFFNNNNDLTDNYGHGTKVAGTAAARGNNGVGVSGIAPKAQNLGIRISDDSGYGSWSAMANGVIYAADKGARVANLSFANSCNSATINSAADYLRKKGGILTVSAGNSGGDNAMGASSFVTCVSATGPNDLRTSWSSYGASVDVSAPGAGIYTTTNGGGYGAPSGTSFSAPLVAGIYALMFSANPALTPAQADNILYTTADDLGEPGWDMYYGWGRVNASKAVAAALAAIGTRDTIAPSVPTNLIATSKSSSSIGLSWSASSDDNSGVAGYTIYRNGMKITTTTSTSYTDASGLSPATSYSYTVSAYDASGNTSALSTASTAMTQSMSFALTSTTASTTASTATIKWSTNLPSSGKVLYGTSMNSLTSSMISPNSNITSDALTLTGLRNKTTYYYQVVVTDTTGKTIPSSVIKMMTKNR